ncbi:hypothetical protein FNH05_32210, partial [Amycolatopsis rhizosphaerae]
MADATDIQEPSDQLFIRTKQIWGIDAIWPRDSEGDAKKLADSWDALATALTKLINDSKAPLKDLSEAWSDLAGYGANESIRNYLVGGNGDGGLLLLVDQCKKLAELCRGYAKSISDMKGEIIADLAFNVALFGLSFALAGPLGEAFFAARFGAMIAGRMAQFAAKVEEMGAFARFATQGAINVGIGAAFGGLGNLAGQELSNLRGYGPINWGDVAKAAGTGALAGGVAHAVYVGPGKWVTNGVTQAVGRVPGVSDAVAAQLGNTAGAAATGLGAGALTGFVTGGVDGAVDGAIGGAAIGGSGALSAHGGRNTYERISGNQANTLADLIKPGADGGGGGDHPPTKVPRSADLGASDTAAAPAAAEHAQTASMEAEHAQSSEAPAGTAEAGGQQTGVTEGVHQSSGGNAGHEETAAIGSGPENNAENAGHENHTANMGQGSDEATSAAAPQSNPGVPVTTNVVHGGEATASPGQNSANASEKAAGAESSARQAPPSETPGRQGTTGGAEKPQQPASPEAGQRTQNSANGAAQEKTSQEAAKKAEVPAASDKAAPPAEKQGSVAHQGQAEPGGQPTPRGKTGPRSQKGALVAAPVDPDATPKAATGSTGVTQIGEREPGSAPNASAPHSMTTVEGGPAGPREQQGKSGVVIKKTDDPVQLDLVDGSSHTLPAESEVALDRATGEPVLYRQFVGADGKPLDEPITFLAHRDGGWSRTEKPLDPTEYEVWLANANDDHETAELMEGINRLYREGGLKDMTTEQLKSLLRGSPDEVAAAIFEILRRKEKVFLRWTQMAAAKFLGEGKIVNMGPGQGKSFVYLVHAVQEALRDDIDAVYAIQTRESLATRELQRYRRVLSGLDIDIHPITPHSPIPAPRDGRPTIYVGTKQSLSFTKLGQHLLPGEVVGKRNRFHAIVDEIDEAFIYSDTTYFLSKGVDHFAPPEVEAEVLSAMNFVDEHLTREHFDTFGGRRNGLLVLNKEGAEKVVEVLGGAPKLEQVHRLEMAAAAKWEYKRGVHYIRDNGRHPTGPHANSPKGPSIKILDPTTHQVLYDPLTATESRWNGGLAQAIEAKEGVRIRNDSELDTSISDKEIYGEGKLIQSVNGASGTADGHQAEYGAQGLSEDVASVPLYYGSRLQRLADVFTLNLHEKIDALTRDVLDFWTPDGRPQVIIAHRNDLVGELYKRLKAEGMKVEAVDAERYTSWGVKAEDKFAEIINRAGAPGKVLIVNMQGARGVDIPLTEAARKAGGLRVRVTANSPFKDIDIQAENRAARNGDPGDVVFYPSRDDEVFELELDARVQQVVIRYEQAHDEYQDASAKHSKNPTPENGQALAAADKALTEARSGMIGAIPGLQAQAAVERLQTPSPY